MRQLRFLPVSLLALSACSTGENIRVRDRDSALFAGRVRYTVPLTQASERRRQIGIGAEFGAFGTNADYTSPTGRKDYRVAVGYAAFVADIGLGPVQLLPKIGVGVGDFAVQGQNRNLREDGLGFVVGFEGRYHFAEPFGVFARATTFQRSSLDSALLEAGLSWQPSPQVAFEVGYAVASNVIEEASDLFGVTDNADVESQGLLLSLTLQL